MALNSQLLTVQFLTNDVQVLIFCSYCSKPTGSNKKKKFSTVPVFTEKRILNLTHDLYAICCSKLWQTFLGVAKSISHCYFTRLNLTKMGHLQFCLSIFLGIHRNPKQKVFFNSCEGFLMAALTARPSRPILKNCQNDTFQPLHEI